MDKFDKPPQDNQEMRFDKWFFVIKEQINSLDVLLFQDERFQSNLGDDTTSRVNSHKIPNTELEIAVYTVGGSGRYPAVQIECADGSIIAGFELVRNPEQLKVAQITLLNQKLAEYGIDFEFSEM